MSNNKPFGSFFFLLLLLAASGAIKIRLSPPPLPLMLEGCIQNWTMSFWCDAFSLFLYSETPARIVSLPWESISIPLNFVSGVLQIFATVCTEMEWRRRVEEGKRKGGKYTYTRRRNLPAATVAAATRVLFCGHHHQTSLPDWGSLLFILIR